MLFRSTTSKEKRTRLCKNILRKHAEKVWTIGTIAHWPQPMIVNDNIRNVPDTFIYGSMDSINGFNLDTMYFKNGEAAR